MATKNTAKSPQAMELVDITAFDLVAACTDGHPFVLKNPNGSETGITLIVRGSFAPEVVKYSSARAQKFINEQRFAQRKGKTAPVPSLDEMEADNISGAIVRVAGWEGVRQAYDEDLMRAALKRNPHWTSQIIEESEALGNFGTASASSSPTT